MLAIAASMTVAAVLATLFVTHGLHHEAAAPKAARPRPPSDNRATSADLLATHDQFGITFLNPTLPKGSYWKSRWDAPTRSWSVGTDPDDRWFDSDHGIASYRAEGGDLRISGSVPRMFVHDPARQRQWRNVEITMYFKRKSDAGIPYAGMVAVARSNHLNDTTARCDTRGYGARLRNDGHADFEKETDHPKNQAAADVKVFPHALPKDRWIGFKFIVFDADDGVHLEQWMDLTDGRAGGYWTLTDSLVDNGRIFGNAPCKPGIDPRAELSVAATRKGSESGKPNLCVYFRSDGVGEDGLEYKWGSVREIEVD